MAIVHKLLKGIDLVPLDTKEKLSVNDGLANRCVMCRESIPTGEKTDEHIYPQWLLRKYKLYGETLHLPNGSFFKYGSLTVPCCKECNGEHMSAWEKKIREAVEQGYDAFEKLEEEVIVWWLAKIYYSKFIKETTLDMNIRDSKDGKLFDETLVCAYDSIYVLMSELLKGIHFLDPKPYELYIFKTENKECFDYIDDPTTNTVYIQMGEIIVICSLDSYNLFRIQYKMEISNLSMLEKVHPIQAQELYCKMAYYKRYYVYNTSHNYVATSSGMAIESKILFIDQIRDFDLLDLHITLMSALQRYGIDCDSIKYNEGKIITSICISDGLPRDFYSI